MAKGNIKNYIIGFLSSINNILDAVTKKTGGSNPSPNLKKRIVSSLVLIPLAIYAFYFSKDLFMFLAIAVTILMAFEWFQLTQSATNKRKWHLIGFFYILVPIWSILKLRDIDPNIILWMFFIIWSTDIFAYFAGKNLGGPKLAPKISPNKTWSGMIFGILASMIIGFISSFIFVAGNVAFFVVVSGILAIIEQLSDLLESKFKRIFGVKDSGDIIPGHGGVLDRLDGVILLAPVILVLVFIYSDKFIVN